MQWSTRDRRRATLAAVVVVALVVVAVGWHIWLDNTVGPSLDLAGAQPPPAASAAPSGGATSAPSSIPSPAGRALPKNPGRLGDIVITVTSDSSLVGGVVYRISGGKSQGRKSAPSPFVATGRDTGRSPKAQVAISGDLGAKITTCTIYVGGKKRVSRTARGPGQVEICTVG